VAAGRRPDEGRRDAPKLFANSTTVGAAIIVLAVKAKPPPAVASREDALREP
jgi:hypothetical protein